jgi:hypothetical protein
MSSRIPKDFVGLLEKQHRIAIALLGRVFGLMKFVDEPWWLLDAAEFRIKGWRGDKRGGGRRGVCGVAEENFENLREMIHAVW